MEQHTGTWKLGSTRLWCSNLCECHLRIHISGTCTYWDKPNPPLVPEEFNPTGTYRKLFTIPDNWQEKEIILCADATKGAAYYYLNGGEFVGMNKEGKLPARFNVTEHAKAGET